MSERTLEEIEALAADATPGPYSLHECSQGAELMMLGGPSRKCVATMRIHQVPRHMGEWEEKKRTKTAELLAELPRLLAIAQEQRAEIAAKDKKILALRAESKMKDDAIQKIERQLQDANECRDPAYFAQIGRKRR